MNLADLSTLALQIWQHALRERGATVWTVCDRLTRAGVFAEPREVSVACRELVALWCERQGVERPTLVRDESGAALSSENAVAYVAMLRRASSWIGADKVLVVTHSEDIRRLSDATVVVAEGAVTVVADAGALAA